MKTALISTATYVARRLREPSTLAALSALGVLAGLPPGTVDLALQLFVGAAGLAAIALPDKPSAAPTPAPEVNTEREIS